MIDFKLTLLTALEDQQLAERLRAVSFPDNTDGRAEPYSETAALYPDDGVTVIITDRPELISLQGRNLRVVYAGDRSRLDNTCVYEDVWQPSDGVELMCERCRRLLVSIRDRLAGEFYRSALLATIDTVPDMLWFKRLDGIHMLVNDAFTEIVHKPKSDIVGRDHFYIWDAPRPAEGNEFACAESEEAAIRTGRTYVCDEPVKTREGMKQLVTYKTPVYDPFGKVFGTVGVGHDVTNFSNLGIELSILIENMPFPMTIFSPEWTVVRMNSAFREITGAHDADSFNYKLWKLTVPVPVGEPREDSSRHIVSSEYRIEAECNTRNIMLTEMEIRDYFDNISGYFCTIQDITYQRSYEDSIIRAANTDMLTGMYNRRYFYSYIGGCIGRRFHLLYLDLDSFKAINDKYGHRAGDDVLIKTADLIKRYFPSAVSARLGGDEFAVIDMDEDSGVVSAKCELLKRSFADQFRHYGCGASISAGIVYNDGSITDIDLLIHMSDEKMYAEKKRHHEAAAEG